jgi:hypothetical protein
MMKCPFCHFDNEDGALFCEQCKSDLASVEAPPVHVAEAVPMAVETVPLAGAVVEAVVAEAYPIDAMPPTEAMAPMEVHMAEAHVAEAQTMPLPIEPLATPPTEQVPAVAEAPPPAPPAPEAEAPAPPPPPAPAAAPPPPPAPAAAPAPPPAPGAGLPAGAEPRLVVLRGQKRNVEFPIYEGHNFIGRADEKPVDIDLEDQEPPDRVWSSRQHALITLEGGKMCIEDLNSSNGTFVNRARIYPGQKCDLNPSDVIQIGTVQLKVVV